MFLVLGWWIYSTHFVIDFYTKVVELCQELFSHVVIAVQQELMCIPVAELQIRACAILRAKR